LGRISTELLPGVHGILAVNASSSAHVRFHVARMGAAKDCAIAADCAREIERLNLAVLRELIKRVKPEFVLHHYLDIKPYDAIARGRRSTEVAEFVTKHLLRIEPPSYAAAAALLAQIEAAADAFPWDHRIHIALSRLHLKCGLLGSDAGVRLA